MKLIYKPSSVLDDYLSWPIVTNRLARCMDSGRRLRLNPNLLPCTKWGLHCRHGHPWRGELLPRLFNLALAGGNFLLHFPSRCRDRPLACTLPCGARTFLTCHDDKCNHLINKALYHEIAWLSNRVGVTFCIFFGMFCTD